MSQLQAEMHPSKSVSGWRRAFVVLGTALTLLGGAALPASAATWGVSLDAGSGKTVSIQSSTVGATLHSIGGATTGYWSSGGSRASSRANLSGTVYATVVADVVYQTGTRAWAFCPAGKTCGV